MADSYVTSGAMMKCSMGTTPAKLTVLPTRTVFLAGKPQANISDNKPIVNLGTFGLCRSLAYPPTASATAAALGTLTPMPCMHNTPLPWTGGKMDTLIKGQPALLKSCKCQCLWGGVITLINNGQTGQGAQGVQEVPKKGGAINLAKSGSSSSADGIPEQKGGKENKLVQDTGDNSVSLGGAAAQKPTSNSVFLGGTSLQKQTTNSVSLAGVAQHQIGNSVSLKEASHLLEMIKEQPSSLSEEQRKAKAKNNLELEKALGITKGKPMSIEDADRQSANPNFSNGKEFTVNCATCAAAYALRLQGFDIKAKGNVSGSESLNEWLSFQHSFDIWNNADGTPAQPVLTADWMESQGAEKMTPELYKQYFEETCKEEGVYIVTLGWSGGGGHATILQRDSDGELYYIEPQRYKESEGERLGIDKLYNNLTEDPSPKRGILRVDDKLFNTDYAELFDV